MWWRPNGAGYTMNLDEAGEYEEEEAMRIARGRESDKAIPVDVARGCCSTHVVAGRLSTAMKERGL